MSSIDRKPHCLKREKTLAIPRDFIFFDTETKPEYLPDGSVRQHLKLGWACSYRRAYGRNREKIEWFSFTTADQFWQFVIDHTEKKHKLWVIARNIAFDFTIVKGWKHLRQANFRLKFFHNTGTCSIISVRGKGKSIVFLDSMNWFVESIAKTGDRIGIPKLKIDFETCSDEYLLTYCKRDVEIELENFKLFIRFLEANAVSRLCYTRGSTAMAAYLFRHYHQKIYIHNNEQAINLERDSYRGGRTECFSLGELTGGGYYLLDVNSLYPFVMREEFYPVKYLKILHKPDLLTLAGFLKSHSIIAHCLINTPDPVYAVRRDRTIFPIGQFWVTLTTGELKYAIENDHIVQIETAVVYEQARIFKSYVERFYNLRLEFKSAGVGEYEDLCKKMLNSLYGKFGQKAEVWEKIGECPNEPDRVEVCFVVGQHRTKRIRYLLGEIYELTGYEECFNSFPAIASEVAAYGRLYLWKLMQAAGSGNYFYCDTDSLIVNKTGLYNLQDQISTGVLGGLKIEQIMDSLTIRGVKDYSIPSKEVIKGIRKSAVKIADGVYEQDQWPSFRGLLQAAEPNTYTIKKVRKVLTRKYTKGYVRPDGSIEPLVLADRSDHSLLFY